MPVCPPSAGLVLLLALVPVMPAHAQVRSLPALVEIPDSELGSMRGRYTVAGQSVAWFGVTLLSNWQTASGQQLSGGLQIGFDLRNGNRPALVFIPTVSIGAEGGEAMPVSPHGSRQLDDRGLANAGGLVQAIQLAGDGNVAGNQAVLVLRDGQVPVAGGSSTLPGAADGPGVRIGQRGQQTGVWLELPGQGQVAQWIGPGQMTQRIALGSDGSQVSNLLQMEVIRGPGTVEVPLAQNVAQALGMTRGLGGNGL